jgi:hypothetical protein
MPRLNLRYKAFGCTRRPKLNRLILSQTQVGVDKTRDLGLEERDLSDSGELP